MESRQQDGMGMPSRFVRLHAAGAGPTSGGWTADGFARGASDEFGTCSQTGAAIVASVPFAHNAESINPDSDRCAPAHASVSIAGSDERDRGDDAATGLSHACGIHTQVEDAACFPHAGTLRREAAASSAIVVARAI